MSDYARNKPEKSNSLVRVRAGTRLFGGSWYAHLTRRFLVVVGWLAFGSISAAELPDASSEKVYVSFQQRYEHHILETSTANTKLLRMTRNVFCINAIYAEVKLDSCRYMLLPLGNAHTDARVTFSANEGSDEKTVTWLTSLLLPLPSDDQSAIFLWLCLPYWT
ncbi:hypothetical protein E4T42_01677 [Aureobasidium subglaciale]|nr:hypothetical protein E4T42_01677 [Aureobasidium subglaciale]